MVTEMPDDDAWNLEFTKYMGSDGYNTGIWGSGPNDVYVCSQQYSHTQGALYHFDGISWTRITDFGVVGEAWSVWGQWSQRCLGGHPGRQIITWHWRSANSRNGDAIGFKSSWISGVEALEES